MENKGEDGVNVTSGIAMPDGKLSTPGQKRKEDELLKGFIDKAVEIVKADKEKQNG